MKQTPLSRRQFVTGVSAATVSAISVRTLRANGGNKPAGGSPKIGLALGSGGANGLAHVLMLEALEEAGIRPHRIAGSSIGAVIGALFAGGMNTAGIRKLIDDFFISDSDNPVERLLSDDVMRLADLIEVDLGNGGILASERLVSRIYETFKDNDFRDLEIPLSIVAADLWSREQIVLDSGELLPAVQASMAIPGVFQPVKHRGKVLVDGGTVNPVPFDLLSEDCDLVIGIDVSGTRTRPEDSVPGYFETLFNSVKVMQQAVIEEKMRRVKPDIFIKPEIVDIRALEFYRAEEVYRQAEPAKEQLKKALRSALKHANG